MMIYCVEDDVSIRELIIYTLKMSGFEAVGLKDGSELFKQLEKEMPELIILDIMLPGEDGLAILKKLKADALLSHIPVIMATAKTSEFDRVTGLDMGADDYLSKPFGMMEMVSRVKAVLRRGKLSAANEMIGFAQVEIYRLKREVYVEGQLIDLTLKEYELLLSLVENKEIVMSRQQLLEKIWGSDYLGESRTIDVHVGTLRSKLGKYGKYIVTVHGVGYCLREKIDG
ncbi:MAG: response regulator transcription factor [Erysipelotrichaceae bacterium]|nr:response regulator transcription factor [Erysipelotrichaceae bacterium]